MAKKGKLIVIEGLDASGKKTQAALLARKLRAKLVSFPVYESSAGRLISLYLHGHMGRKEDVPPQVAALLFAMDRYQQKDKIEKLLHSGKTVVADRYSPSNLYQAAKLHGKKRAQFIKWLDELEEGLPQPDAVVFLDVPTAVAQKLLRKRGAKQDIHEADAKYQEEVRKLYLKEAKRRRWLVVSCVEDGKLRGIKEISAEMLGRLKK